MFFVLFLLLPVLAVFWWSTQKGGVTTGAEFVGLDNYLRLPRQVSAMAAISNTFWFAVLSIPATLVIAFGRRAAPGPRAAGCVHLPLPRLLPGARAGRRRGADLGLPDQCRLRPVRHVLRLAGLQPVTWLGTGTALPVLAAVDVWRSVGYWAIFFLAAIIGLPQELYQAAELDGASTWQRFRRLTLPLLRRILLFAIVVSTIFGLQIFDTALILTNGGPGTSTVTIVFRIWQYVFGESDKVGSRCRDLGHAPGGDPGPDPGPAACPAGEGRRCLRPRLPSPRGVRHGRQPLRHPSRARRARPALVCGPQPRPGVTPRMERVFSHGLLIFVVILLVAPFFFVITASLKDSSALFAYPPQWLPLPLYLGNYEHVLFETGFLRWMFNTLFVAGTVTLIKVFLDSMAGYALAKLEFTGKRVVFLLMLVLLMVPFGVMLIPLWSIAHGLHITNTYLALILPPLANPLGVFLMRQFILALPSDLENAARLDGVSEFGIYRRIILPLMKPGLVVLAVIIFTDQFMSFIWPLVATQRRPAGADRGRRRLPRPGWRELRAVVGGGGDVADADRRLLLRPAAPIPGPVPRRSIEAMSDAVTQPTQPAIAACPIRHRDPGRHQALRRSRRPERRRPGHRAGRVRGPAGPVGLRQEHAAQDHRRPGGR